jgi:hypothetical protein
MVFDNKMKTEKEGFANAKHLFLVLLIFISVFKRFQ